MSEHGSEAFCQVVVCGDVVVEHHLYEGERRKPDVSDRRGVRHFPETGGAEGLRRLLQSVYGEEARLYQTERAARDANSKAADPRTEPRPIRCALGVAKPDLAPLHAPHHAFALWRPYKISRDSDATVWRTTDVAMGYGDEPDEGEGKHLPKPRTLSGDADVLVLDDAGSQFRSGVHELCWHLSDVGADSWILLKMSDPIAQGDLWRELVRSRADQLVVLVSAADLRREPVRIGQHLSWEQTLEDLAAELDKQVLKPLLRAAHLIVTFGGDAAVWIARGEKDVAHLCFDGGAAEGDFAEAHDGRAIGYMTCMAAALAYSLTQASGGAVPDFRSAMQSGLRGMRDLLLYGHGPSGSGSDAPVGFPVPRLAKAMRAPAPRQGDFFRIDIPWPPPTIEGGNWMIVETSQRPFGGDGPRSVAGLAEAVLRRGSDVYARLPYLQFGDFITAERREIEALRGIRKLMLDYKRQNQTKPLSIGVFGPPGAGKSFAVREIASSLFGKEAWLEFNLSQFEGAADLIGAFHKVRDEVLKGKVPVAFWDEFDSQDYQWLRSLLAPMQDGKFQEGQVTHPIGRAVFIFAGGTAPSFDDFGPEKPKADAEDDPKWRHWQLRKGPDFKSRLDAYYDVAGPNQRRKGRAKELDTADYGHPLRRALFIRSKLGYKGSETLRIDSGLSRALLLAGDYQHGSRSMEKLVVPLAGPAKSDALRRSALPPRVQMGMYVTEPDSFFRHLDQDAGFTGPEVIEVLAKAIHAKWRGSREAPGESKSQMFDREWGRLTDFGKETNREAARRIPAVLALVGLGVTNTPGGTAPETETVMAHLEHNIERLAEAEHDGWQDFLLRNGWRHGAVRDDDERVHPLLVPYRELPSEAAKNKDRESVRHYPAHVDLAGFRIVWLGEAAGGVDAASPTHRLPP